MKKSNETDSLNELILLQQKKYHTDLALLKEQFGAAYESVKPINFIKNLSHEVTTSPEIKNDLGTNIIGLATGFISKKLLVDSSHSIIRRVFGTVAQFAIANVVSKHSDTIKNIGNSLFNQLLKRIKN